MSEIDDFLSDKPSQSVDDFLSDTSQPKTAWDKMKAAAQATGNFLGNSPTMQNIYSGAIKYGPPAIGTLAAGAATGGASLPVQAAAMALGAGGGEAISKLPGQIKALATGQQQPQTSSDVAKDIAKTAAAAAGTQGALGVAGKVAVAAGLPKILAQFMRAFPNIPEKYGAAALTDLGNLSKAPSEDTMQQAYNAFEKYAGLKGIKQQIGEREQSFAPSELEKIVLGIRNKLLQGKDVPNQDLYTASQAANKLQRMAKYGEPQAKDMMESGLVAEGGDLADTALQKTLPEYGPLRNANFLMKMKQAFESPVPLNKNGTPDALRTWGTGIASGGTKLPFISPMLYGLAIRGTNRVAQALPAVAAASQSGKSGFTFAQSLTPEQRMKLLQASQQNQ